MKINKIKGFSDLFLPESSTFTAIESKAREIFQKFGFEEVRTPLLEFTELFKRSIGEDTDVVHKEMYTFSDEKGRSYSLRPEATAGVMRAYIENSIYSKETISRLFTIGPMFRHERPQKGRLRQFNQINCECLGSESPICDAEIIMMLWNFLATIGLKDHIELHLNSLGCKNCRPLFKEALSNYLTKVDPESLCEDCKRRMTTNPLRVLDCKQESCKQVVSQAPQIQDYLCPDCKDHFNGVLKLLDNESLHYVLDPKLVRGLDYYCRTTFEVVSTQIGAQSAVAGGGRYDGLIAMLGGPDIAGIGFACGLERLALLVPPLNLEPLDFYLLVLDEKGLPKGFSLAQELRSQGQRGLMNFKISGFKSLMRQADKSKAKYTLILGEDELAKEVVTIKNMATGEQLEAKFCEVLANLA